MGDKDFEFKFTEVKMLMAEHAGLELFWIFQ